MKNAVWQVEDGGGTDAEIMAFLAGDDVQLDNALFHHDVTASIAHVKGLARVGILNANDEDLLCELLTRLKNEFDAGTFVLDERFEDGHSAIEYYLTEHAGEAGEKVHTGRSRNDQVLVASRLYLKDAIAKLADLISQVGLACLELAETGQDMPMPGYTHLQHAVPSSMGMWMAGYAEGFADTLAFAKASAVAIDCNPLGTAAGYGVNLRLDREGVSEDLGFGRMQLNPIGAQNSRGKFEIMALQVASHALHDVQRLAWDLSLFAMQEFGFVSLPERYTTGSSIMPNKRNPDVVELLRARPAMIDACIQEIQNICALPSGYHRDLQFTKAPMIRGLSGALQALSIVPGLVQSLEFDEGRMAAAISAQMYATDAAVEFAIEGEPFRSAYRKVKKQLGSLSERDPLDSLQRRVSPGACGDLRLEEIRCRLASEN